MKRLTIPEPNEALPGRDISIPVEDPHITNGRNLESPFPEETETLVVAMGCFWGAERKFWETDGVWVTAVGYVGGTTPNPTYEEVCTGLTGHTEAVLVVFNPLIVSLEEMLITFWENHDPTQGMRQGNDIGTQYRSGIYFNNAEQLHAAQATKNLFSKALDAAGYGTITTEIKELDTFYYAERGHQQYLARNPFGYCGIGGTGVTCPTGVVS